jgi:hypothetical protein
MGLRRAASLSRGRDLRMIITLYGEQWHWVWLGRYTQMAVAMLNVTPAEYRQHLTLV